MKQIVKMTDVHYFSSRDLQQTMTGRLQVTDPEDSGRFSQLPSQGAGSRKTSSEQRQEQVAKRVKVQNLNFKNS